MKSRLPSQGGVANHRNSMSYCSGLRLALNANPSISFCSDTYGLAHQEPVGLEFTEPKQKGWIDFFEPKNGSWMRPPVPGSACQTRRDDAAG